MVLAMHSRTASPSTTFLPSLPKGIIARRTVTDRVFKPRYFAEAGPHKPSWEVRVLSRLTSDSRHRIVFRVSMAALPHA